MINDLDGSAIAMQNNRIVIDEQGKTSAKNIWAGGDCVAGGNDLTVSAVQDGKIAAQSINAYLQGSH